MESIYEDISGNIIDQLGLVLSEQIDAIRIRVKNCNGEERMLSPYSASTGSRVFGYIFKKRNTGAYYRLVNLGPNSNVGNEVVAQLEELPSDTSGKIESLLNDSSVQSLVPQTQEARDSNCLCVTLEELQKEFVYMELWFCSRRMIVRDNDREDYWVSV